MLGLMPNGKLRQANLKMLFQKAKQYESSNFKGLYSFIRFIDKLKLSSGDLGSAKLMGENDNVIRIMSIHKSKGLEFPVVFLASTGKQFNLMDLNQNVLLHQEMGIGVTYIDYDKQIQYDTLSKLAIRNKIFVETLSEEMRILYVALTRAKEKLIITGIVKDYEKEIGKMKEQVEQYEKCQKKINPILVKKYQKYLDWILLVYQYEKGKDMELKVYKKQEIMKKFQKMEQEDIDVKQILESKEINQEQLERIEKILNTKYPHPLATLLPTKTSVTHLKQMADKQEQEPSFVVEFPKPEFLKEDKEEKLTAAQKGTLIHLCLQKLDEKREYDLNQIKELIRTLQERQIITQKEAESIQPFKILEFTKSPIWQDLKQAKEVQKEKPFYSNISAKEIEEEATDEVILVQGVIDLYYRDKNDNLVLVDYKTDYVEKGKEIQLIDKYRKQLEIYEKALEEALHKKVSQKYIYSVYLGKALEV